MGVSTVKTSSDPVRLCVHHLDQVLFGTDLISGNDYLGYPGPKCTIDVAYKSIPITWIIRLLYALNYLQTQPGVLGQVLLCHPELNPKIDHEPPLEPGKLIEIDEQRGFTDSP
jgi:hypothetical protein